MGRGKRWGSIAKVGDRYRARYPDPTNPGKKIHLGYYSTKASAEAALAKVRVAIESGGWLDPRLKHNIKRLGDFAEGIIENGVNRSGLPYSVTTKQNMRGYWQRGLKSFYNLHPEQVTPAMVRDWHSERSAKTPTSAGNEAMHLRAVFNRLIEEGVFKGRNPVPKNLTRSVTGVEYTQITTEQFQALLEAFSELAPHLRLMVLLAAVLGCRTGELRALQRADFVKGEDNRYRVRINKQAIYDSAQGEWIGSHRTKTNLKRTLELPLAITAEVDAHLSAYVGEFDKSLVFKSKDRADGTPSKHGYVSPRSLHRVWLKACLIAGIDYLVDSAGNRVPYNPEDYKGGAGKKKPDYKQVHRFRFHDLRGLAVIVRAEQGATVSETMHQVGHNQLSTHQRYLTTRPSDREKQLADATYAELMGGSNVTSLETVRKQRA